MMRQLRRLPALSALTLLLAMLAAVVVSAPASADYPSAYNTKTTYLSSWPTSGMSSACVSRRIYLASGTYNWGEVLDGHSKFRRALELQADTYTWTDCLIPQSGVYRHTSWLDPDNPGWNYVRYDNNAFGVITSGNHKWGSYLDPRF